jgi:protease stability complex PrcB-like protein
MMVLILMMMMAQTPGPSMATVGEGSSSGIDEPNTVIVRSVPEWGALWKSHAGLQPAPAVDFSTNLVAAVFLGMRPTAGYRVEIVGIRRENDALIVEYVERRPAADAIVSQVLTSPFHIVKLPRFNGPIRFRQRGVGAP